MVKSFKRYGIWVVLCFLGMLATACNSQQKNGSEPKKTSQDCLTTQQLSALKPTEVTPVPVIEKLRLTGKVTYNPNAMVNYVSLVSGVIVHSYVSLGDHVKKDQVLAEIKSAELNAMKSEVRQLKAKLKVADRELESVRHFYEDGIASEREWIEAQSDKENLESELESLQNTLDMYHAVSGKDYFQIKAPQSGFMVDNKLVTGLQIGAEGEPLFTISDMNEVWININIYATDFRFVKEGMPIDIKVNAYPNQVFNGKINRISHVMDPDENVLKAQVALKNEGFLLKPGLQVEGIVRMEKDEKMPRLSDRSVVYHNNKYYVMIIEDACRVYSREVKLYLQDEHTMYIQSGLKAGEHIVSANALLEFEHFLSNP